tara:strand:- start:127 stop:753 length:627 start_codon:yes stop_codon:yes gene_type:complete
MTTSTDSPLDCLHRLDLTQMTMTGGVSKRGTFGAVAKIREGEFPTFVLAKPCVVHEITGNGNIVVRVTNPLDRDSLVGLQSSMIVLLFSLMPMTDGMTCNDATSMVRHMVVHVEEDASIYFSVCVAHDEPNSMHRPTRIHVRHNPDDAIERDVGLHRLREGQTVYPIFHVSGAAMDPSIDRLVPHISVSDVIVCCCEDGDYPGVCTPT